MKSGRPLDFCPGSTRSDAYALNNQGEVVGRSGWDGFLYTNGRMYDLNQITSGIPDGWRIAEARGINDHGQIVGVLQLGTVMLEHAFLLEPLHRAVPSFGPDWELRAHASGFSAQVHPAPLPEPVPEPSSFALAALFGAAFFCRRPRVR